MLQVLLSAVAIALLGSLDSLLTSLVMDNIRGTRHRSNKELIGQGIGNIAAGLFGGLSGAGATVRSVVNVRNGGQTALSAATTVSFCSFSLPGLVPWCSTSRSPCCRGY